jgi:RNA polymerase sigma-70 factor (ECF subfamily)
MEQMTTIMANTVSGIDGRQSDRAPAEFDDLFRAHRQRLVDSLTLVAGNRERADDAVQEAFVKAHLKWRKIRRYDDPIGWVRRVAINRLKDEHRSEGRKQRAVERLANRPAQDATDGHLDGTLDDMTARIQQLPRQQRLCIALFYIGELSVAEIANDLDIAEGSVKSHLHDGRRALRKRLEAEGTTR